jgi:hypothetical protein
MRAHLRHGDAMNGGVDLAVAAAVESHAQAVAARGGDRGDPGEAGELRGRREALDAGDLGDQLGGRERPDAGSSSSFGCCAATSAATSDSRAFASR